MDMKSKCVYSVTCQLVMHKRCCGRQRSQSETVGTMMARIQWTIISLWIFSQLSNGNEMNPEEKLFTFLFDQNRYDKRARPSRVANRPANITIRYEFNQLYDVSEKAQTVSVLSTVYQEWHDYRLYWNISDFDNLASIPVDGISIWTPDTTLYNEVDMYRPGVEDSAKAIISPIPNSNTTLVSYFYNCHHTIGCRFDMRYFPFDTQNCTFEFGSWSQDGSMIDYYPKSDLVTTEDYQPSDIWTLMSFKMERIEYKYDCCLYPYIVIKAHLVIRRKSLYYAFNLIIPTVVINVLSSYALFSSEGSPDNRHDKLQIGLTTLLSYCILLLSVSDQVPKGSTSVPLLGIFYIVVMLQNALELVASIYLSFPENRTRLMSIFNRIVRGRKWKNKVTTVKGNMYDDKDTTSMDPGHYPEYICLCVGIISTAILTSIVFAVGLTV